MTMESGGEHPFTGPAEFLRAHARHRGDAVCLVDEALGRTLTFDELDRRVNALSNRLLGEGLGAGDRVAVLATDSHQYLEVILACARTGITYVALNVRLAPAELDDLVARARPSVLFLSDRYLDEATRLQPLLQAPARVAVFGTAQGRDDYETLLAGGDESVPGVAADPEGILSLAFTSGTTGRAKGVLQSLRMMTNVIAGGIIDFDIRADDVRYAAAPLFHIAGAAFPLMAMALGATSVMLPPFDAPTVLGNLQADRFTGVFMVPTMISSLLQLPAADRSSYDRLRCVLYGASAMTPGLLRRAMNTFSCDFIQGFGATETGTQFVLSAADHRRALAGEERLLASSGRPALGAEVRIVDAELRDVAPGEVGEIASRSNQQLSGYLDSPDEAASTWTVGWFRCGDLGHFDDEGYLFLAGRKHDMIVRGGENIYPIEIESVLSEHPAVAEVAVVGRPDDHWGEVVHAFIVRRTDATDATEAADSDPLDSETLTTLCRSRLAGYKVPAVFEIVDELPKNAAGKVLKRVLRDGAT